MTRPVLSQSELFQVVARLIGQPAPLCKPAMEAHSPPTSDTGPSQPRRRPGPQRSVASLNEEQRRHKREIDRRAQRALRQRAKDCMLKLEQQFARLQETCAQQEKEIARLREENKKLHRCQEAIRDCLAGNPKPVTTPEGVAQGTGDTRGRGQQVISRVRLTSCRKYQWWDLAV